MSYTCSAGAAEILTKMEAAEVLLLRLPSDVFGNISYTIYRNLCYHILQQVKRYSCVHIQALQHSSAMKYVTEPTKPSHTVL